jgi:hypothetical protein
MLGTRKILSPLARYISPINRYRVRIATKKAVAAGISFVPRARLTDHPAVTIFMVNANNCDALRLTIESLRKHTVYPSYKLWVADNCSTDGSLEYLRTLGDSVRIIQPSAPRQHWEWLDWAFHEVETPLWVGMDNDLYFLGSDWLSDMIRVMNADAQLYLVGGEKCARSTNFVEPVGGETIELGERFSAYLFCMRTTLRDHLQTSFAFYKFPKPDGAPQICLDTGGKLMHDMRERGLRYSFMPNWFAPKWHHIGNLTWAFSYNVDEQTRQLKRFQLDDIRRRLSKGGI